MKTLGLVINVAVLGATVLFVGSVISPEKIGKPVAKVFGKILGNTEKFMTDVFEQANIYKA